MNENGVGTLAIGNNPSIRRKNSVNIGVIDKVEL